MQIGTHLFTPAGDFAGDEDAPADDALTGVFNAGVSSPLAFLPPSDSELGARWRFRPFPLFAAGPPDAATGVDALSSLPAALSLRPGVGLSATPPSSSKLSSTGDTSRFLFFFPFCTFGVEPDCSAPSAPCAVDAAAKAIRLGVVPALSMLSFLLVLVISC